MVNLTDQSNSLYTIALQYVIVDSALGSITDLQYLFPDTGTTLTTASGVTAVTAVGCTALYWLNSCRTTEVKSSTRTIGNHAGFYQ